MSIIFPQLPSTYQSDLLPDAGYLFLGANGSAVPFALTADGFKFDRGVEYTDPKIDGMRARIKGLQRITKYDSMMSGKIIQFGDNQMLSLEAGAASASGSGIVGTYWEMQAAGAFLAAGSYGTDLRWVFKRASGLYFQTRFHYWLCTKYSLTAKDKTGTEIDCSFVGLIDPTNTNPATGVDYTINDAPYLFEDILSSASAL